MRFVDTNILLYSLDLEPAQPAKAGRCRELLSEDLNHGQDYDGVIVVNPFLGI